MKTDQISYISGKIVDVINQRIYPGKIEFQNGIIVRIIETETEEEQFICPGFIDSHLHIESSLLIPSEFARASIPHGTIGCVCDPHEIANVVGIEGIDFMIRDGLRSPMKYCFGVPSCVPATRYETAGANIDAHLTDRLLERQDLYFLGEMMNYEGVLNNDPEVIDKIDAAKKHHKPIDGHAPHLHGNDLQKYVASGISTDHECASYREGFEKIKLGMIIQIRDGSAATDFNNLIELVRDFPNQTMFCTDDKHPDDLISGHMNLILAKAVKKGIDPVTAIRACTLTPVRHYKMDVGLLRQGDPADFIILKDLQDFEVKTVYINGICVASNGKSLFEYKPLNEEINQFKAELLDEKDLIISALSDKIRAMKITDGELFTKTVVTYPNVTSDNNVISDPERDLLKLVVLNRYSGGAKLQFGFVKNFGLKQGAFASSVGHDSHNLIAIGTDDQEIAQAMNWVIQNKGGLVACRQNESKGISLPIAGLMSPLPFEEVSSRYQEMSRFVSEMGSSLHAPFLTLAFLSLPVIPELRLTDKGLFDVYQNKFVSLFIMD